jgi:hypothetical protein
MTTLDIDGSASTGRQYYQYKVAHTGAIDADLTTGSASYDAVIAAFLETVASTLPVGSNAMPGAVTVPRPTVLLGPPNTLASGLLGSGAPMFSTIDAQRFNR